MKRRVGAAGSASLRAIGVAFALALAVAPAVADSAAAEPYNPSHLAASDRASVAGLCEGVMGVSRGTARFDACVKGLSDSVVGVARARDLVWVRNDCLGRGLALGSAALAECELREKDAPRARPVLVTDPGAAPTPRGSPYWGASNAEIRRREELSCARLGLEPVGAPFAGCVAQLDAALFVADNPAH